MKKFTLRIALLTVVMLFATATLQAQGTWTENGTYKISVPGQDLFMTINGATGALEWAAELAGDDPTQVWAIVDHRTPASTGLMEITANIPGVGTFTMATNGVEADHPNYTLIARFGEPVSVTPLTDDYSGLDQFQRRKTNPAPEVGNNALFLRTPWGTNSRYGVAPTAAGDPVQFDGGGIDALEFTLVDAITSAEEFDASSIFVSNPVNDQLIIKGLTNNVNQVSVYSLIGKRVLDSKVDGRAQLTLGASVLSSGMYIVKITGDNGSFSKKIVKQ